MHQWHPIYPLTGTPAQSYACSGYYDCEYEACSGCTDPNACNYDEFATIDDESCNYSCWGCTQEAACNYDPFATLDLDLNNDGITDFCDFETCRGCMNQLACDFNTNNNES